MFLWICGQLKMEWKPEGVAWEFAGVFTDEVKAVMACRDESYFVFPAEPDQALPHETTCAPAGAYYPLEQRTWPLPREEDLALFDVYRREVALLLFCAGENNTQDQRIINYLSECCKHTGMLITGLLRDQAMLFGGQSRVKICALFRARLKALIRARRAFRKPVMLATIGSDALIQAETAAYAQLAPLDGMYIQEIEERPGSSS